VADKPGGQSAEMPAFAGVVGPLPYTRNIEAVSITASTGRVYGGNSGAAGMCTPGGS
jgi:hypothetical protein